MSNTPNTVFDFDFRNMAVCFKYDASVYMVKL